jgi:hypothetical protein
MELIGCYTSNFGTVYLSRWLSDKADRLPTRKNGMVDMRFRASKRYFARLENYARARYLAETPERFMAHG